MNAMEKTVSFHSEFHKITFFHLSQVLINSASSFACQQRWWGEAGGGWLGSKPDLRSSAVLLFPKHLLWREQKGFKKHWGEKCLQHVGLCWNISGNAVCCFPVAVTCCFPLIMKQKLDSYQTGKEARRYLCSVLKLVKIPALLSCAPRNLQDTSGGGDCHKLQVRRAFVMHLCVFGICCCPALFAMNCNAKEMDLFTFNMKRSNTGVAACSFLRKLPPRSWATAAGWTQQTAPEPCTALRVRTGFATAENRLTPPALPAAQSIRPKGTEQQPRKAQCCVTATTSASLRWTGRGSPAPAECPGGEAAVLTTGSGSIPSFLSPLFLIAANSSFEQHLLAALLLRISQIKLHLWLASRPTRSSQHRAPNKFRRLLHILT